MSDEPNEPTSPLHDAFGTTQRLLATDIPRHPLTMILVSVFPTYPL